MHAYKCILVCVCVCGMPFHIFTPSYINHYYISQGVARCNATLFLTIKLVLVLLLLLLLFSTFFFLSLLCKYTY